MDESLVCFSGCCLDPSFKDDGDVVERYGICCFCLRGEDKIVAAIGRFLLEEITDEDEVLICLVMVFLSAVGAKLGELFDIILALEKTVLESWSAMWSSRRVRKALKLPIDSRPRNLQ